jgi:hypothetical protein
MPSKSKAQQRFFGMVDAYKKGEIKNPSSKIKKAANGMSMSDVKDFAETKHKGLPEKVEEQTIIRLTESDLHKIVKESVNRILNEGKIESWQPDEFVTWDEYQYYCGHGADWVDKNRERSDKLGVPYDQRCGCCQKPLKSGYKTLYVSDDYNDIGYYAHPNKSHNREVKIGKACAKAFEKAHQDKYGY